MTRNLLPSLLATALLAACTDEGPEPTVTTPTTFEGFQPRSFGVTAAEFAIDATGRAGGWNGADDTPRPATMTLAIADATVTTAGWTEGNFCTLTWRWTEPVAPAVIPETEAWSRWIPPSAEVDDTCVGFEFPPAWNGDVLGTVEASIFGFGVGPLDARVRDSLEDSFGDVFDEVEPYIGGGGFFWDGLQEEAVASVPDVWRETGWIDTGVVYAYELDASGAEVLAGGLPVTLLADDLWNGTSLLPARYELQGTTLLTPATTLVGR